MLILTRKLGETIRINNEIKVTILEVRGKQIRIGIDAPSEVPVHREEVYQMIQKQNILAADCGDLKDIWNRLKKQREETR